MTVRTLPHCLSWRELKAVSLQVALRRYWWISLIGSVVGLHAIATNRAAMGAPLLAISIALPIIASYARSPGRALQSQLQHDWTWEFEVADADLANAKGTPGSVNGMAKQIADGELRGSFPLSELQRTKRIPGYWLLYVNNWMYVSIPDRAFESADDRLAAETIFRAAGLTRGPY